ncbi:MAG: PilZ domain-containing protein [Erythrobacter sp.]
MTVPKRQTKRTSIFLHGSLERETGTQEVRVRDVSVDGALLDVSQPVAIFEPVTLVCGRSRITGMVVWTENGRAGVEFAEPITGSTLTDSLETKLKVSAPKNYRKGEIADSLD